MLAQQGTTPVGVNWVKVTFDSPPSTLNIEQAPLKYNKDFAISFQMDDGNPSIYTHGFPVFEGGEITTNPGIGTYAGYTYTDGCGESINFRMSSAIYSFNGTGDNGPDIHDTANNYSKITWPELGELYEANWGIQNHGVNESANSDPLFVNYSLKRNKSFIMRKMYSELTEYVRTNTFVNPVGNIAWNPYAFDQGYLCALNQDAPSSPFGDYGCDVNDPSIPWTSPQSIFRRFAENLSVQSFIDIVAGNSTGGSNYWVPLATHSLTQSWGYDFSDFVPDFLYIANTYGEDGLDNILITTDEEILDYLIVRDTTDINWFQNGNEVFIFFSGEVPDNLMYYSMSLVIESDANITSIIVDGTSDYSHSTLPDTDALVNLNWEGQNLPSVQYLADSMTTIASSTQSEYDCWVAMDYVITLENGSHKDSLREVLCNIPNVVYDEGFCDCEINLQISDTTILLGESITLTGPDGSYDYEWYKGDVFISSSQEITETPQDTTSFYLTATNNFGCPSTDSTIVNVHWITLNLQPDTSYICRGDSITLSGPPGMTDYLWEGENNTYYTQDITVSPLSSMSYKLTITDNLGATASDSTFVIVRLLPTITIQSPDTTVINLGEFATLVGPAGYFNYQWYDTSNLISTNKDAVVSPPDTTMYTLYASDQHGCQGSDSAIVSVIIIQVDLGPDTTICSGECVDLYGPPDMTNYIWYENNNLFASTQNISACPYDTSQYSLLVIDQFGNSASDTITINVLPVPDFDLQTNDTTINIGDSINLHGAAGNYTWEWYIGDSLIATTQDITQWPADTTTYTHIATNNYNCTSEDSIIVNINYQIVDLGPDTTICSGDCVHLEGPPGMDSYIWYENDLIYQVGVQSIDPCPLVDSEYKLIVFDNNGDLYQDSIMVFVDPTPIVNLQQGDTTIVIGDSLWLYGATGNFTWEWRVDDVLIGTTKNIQVAPLDSTTTFMHYAFNSDSCPGIDSIIVNVNYNYLGSDLTLCEGNCDSLFGPQNMLIYIWYENGILQPWTDSEIEVCPEENTEYVLQVISSTGNNYYDTVNVNVVSLPNVVIQPANDTVAPGDSLQLYVQDFYATYEWYEEGTLLPDTTYSIYVHPELDSVLYTVIVSDANQCVGEDSTYVYVNPIIFDLGPDTTICDGNCVHLEGPPDMSSYIWYENNQAYQTGSQSIDPCPIIDSEYKLIVFDNEGNSYQDSVMVYVNPTPSINLQPTDTTIIIGDSVWLYGASGNYTWEWWVDDILISTDQDIHVAPVDSPTTYIHYAFNSDSCYGVDSIIVNVNYQYLGPDISLCEGSCDSLIGPQNMFLYIWYEDGVLLPWTASEMEVCPDETTEFVLRVIDNSGNNYYDTVNVNVLPLPDVVIQPANDTVKLGDSLELYVQDFYETYQWYEEDVLLPDTTYSIFVHPDPDSVLYSVIVTDANQCIGNDSTYVYVNTLSFDLGPDDTICQSECYELVGPPDMQVYRWYANATLLPYTNDTIVVCPDTTTMYTLWVRNDAGYTAEDSLNITVFPLPTSYFENDSLWSCLNDDLVLEVIANAYADTFYWEFGGQDSITVVNTVTYENITSSAYAYVTAVSSNDCYFNDSVYVTVYDYPTITVSNDTTICSGDSVLLIASGAESYFWTLDNDTVSTASSFWATSYDTAVYIVNGSYLNSICYTTDSIIVNVNFQCINLGPDTTICDGNCVHLEGPPGMNSYIWYENDLIYQIGSQSIDPCPIIDSEYKLVVIDAVGDSYQDSVMVYVKPTPVVNLQPSDTTIIIGDSIWLYGANGNYTWEWWVDDILMYTTQDIHVAPVDSPTTYIHYAFNSDSCYGVDSIIVNVNYQYLGPDISLCEGSCDSLYGPENMMIYLWYEDGELLPWTTSEIEVCPEETTEYVSEVYDFSGNTYYDTVNVNVVSLPDVTIQPANDTINLGDSLELYVQDFYETYQWYEEDTLLPDTTYSIFVHPMLDSVLYRVIVTDTNQCVGEDSTYVYVNPFSFDLGPDDTICQYQCYELVGPPDMLEYRWYADTTLLPYATDTIVVCPDTTTMYTLYVETGAGATAEDSLTLTVFPSPTAYFENDTLWSCINDDLVLEVIASADADTFYWEYDDREAITVSNTVTFESITSSAYAYVMAVSINECYYIDSAYVTVNDYPTITVSNDTTICSGDSVLLIASGAESYYWTLDNDTISTAPSFWATPIDTAIYFVNGSYLNSVCYTEDTVIVAVFPQAETRILYDTTLYCRFDSVKLIASGASSYLWLPSGDTTDYYNFMITDTTTIKLFGETELGCISVDSVEFFSLPMPDVSIEPLLPAYCFSDPAVVLVGEPEGGLFGGDGIVGGEFLPHLAGPGSHSVYYRFQSTESGCWGSDTTYTTVYGSDSQIDLGNDTTLRENDILVLDAGPGFDNYVWNTGATTQSITVMGSDHIQGTYEYSVMGIIGGCPTPGSVFVSFEGPDRVGEDIENKIQIYPNPNTGRFTVRLNNNARSMSINIIDLKGVSVYSEKDIECGQDCTTSIDLVGLEAGLYYIQIVSDGDILSSKIILK